MAAVVIVVVAVVAVVVVVVVVVVVAAVVSGVTADQIATACICSDSRVTQRVMMHNHASIMSATLPPCCRRVATFRRG